MSGGGAPLPGACVVDASVAVKWLVAEADSARAAPLLRDARRLHAPALLRVECANILRKKHRRGIATRDEAVGGLALPDRVGLAWVDDMPHVAGALRRALGLDHPACDCVYLEVAASLRLPLVTADRRLAAFSGRDGATVLHLDSFGAAAGPSLGAP